MGGIATPNPMMASPAINPILAEIDAAHANLSPDAQAAIEKAHGIAAPNGDKAAPVVGPMVEPRPPLSHGQTHEQTPERQYPGLMLRTSGEPEPSVSSTFTPAGIAAPNGPATEPPPGGGIQAPAPTTVGAGIMPPGAASPRPINRDAIPGISEPAQDAAADNVSNAKISAPSDRSGISSMHPLTLPTTAAPEQTAHQKEYARLTAPPPSDSALLHTKANTGAPGKDQIHNPFLRTLATIGDVIGTGFFPRAAAAIPGTSLHHQVLVNAAKNAEATDEGERNDATKRELEEAQAQKDLHPGETKDWQEIAGGAIDPAHPELGPQPAFYNKNDPGQGLKFGNASLGKKEAAEKHDVHAMYADAVNDALKRGVEPKDDPKVQQTLAAITALNKEPNPSKPDVHVLYADAISDAIKRGVDPNEDPKVQQIAKSITGLQKEGGHNVPLEEQVINEHIAKVHPGDTMAQARQHTQPAPQRDPTAALDRETTKFAKPHEKSIADATAQLEKISDARAMINGNAESQALGIPKVLTALVSGAGSGVRITQPELNAIGTARGVKGDVEGFINSISGKGKLTDTQKQQLTGILNDVEARVRQKQAIANDALDKINGAGSREEIIQHDKDARKALSDLEKGGGGQSVPEVKTKAEFDKLPSGAVYMENGHKFKKP